VELISCGWTSVAAVLGSCFVTEDTLPRWLGGVVVRAIDVINVKKNYNKR